MIMFPEMANRRLHNRSLGDGSWQKDQKIEYGISDGRSKVVACTREGDVELVGWNQSIPIRHYSSRYSLHTGPGG